MILQYTRNIQTATAMGAVNPALTIFASGNARHADDGLGPMLAERIQLLQHPCLVLVADIELRIQHATDIRNGVPALFIDASIAIDQGFLLRKLRPAPDHAETADELSPPALLRLFESTMQQPAPPAYELQVAGTDFERGESLSTVGRQSADAAWRFLRRVLAEPSNVWAEALEIASADPLQPGPA